MTYQHGISVSELNTGSRTLTTVSTAVIGMVATANDADADYFPLNRPVLVTDIETAIGNAGTSGTLASALQAIADQTKPTLVVVRVTEGADAGATAANVIGTVAGGQKTGMQALLAAEAQTGAKPRILGAPGLDTHDVTVALAAVAKSLRAMVYASAGATSVADAITYRQQFGQRELMLLYPDFLAFDTDAQATVTSSAVARALGLRAQIDVDQGFHKTLSNVVVQGVTGLSRDVQFDIQDTSTEANLLNAAGVTACVNASGYRFWGSRTCSDDPLFAFESATRTAQVLMDTIGTGLMWAIDKPLVPSLVKDVVETINGELRDLVAAGQLIGGSCWFDPAKNTTDVLKSGKVQLDYDYTPVPPLENMLLTQRITDSYFANFAAGLNPSAS